MSAVAPRAASEAVDLGLEASELGHRYGRRLGLAPISFRAAAPGVMAVVGPNGSGKSTLLRIAAGLLRPSEGSIVLRAEDREADATARRRLVGYAAADLSFYDELSGAENLQFVAEARGLDSPGERVAEVLQLVGLDRRGDDRVAAMSSGMRQRLRLAGALLHGPRLLLLDEPSSHLDDEGRERLESVIVEFARQGLVLIATNDEREWKLAGSRIELRGRGLGRIA